MDECIVRLLDLGLSTPRTHPVEHCRTIAQAQTDTWSRLGGRWISDAPIEDEIAAVYSARSDGRSDALLQKPGMSS